jgi:hypothetical protein
MDYKLNIFCFLFFVFSYSGFSLEPDSQIQTPLQVGKFVKQISPHDFYENLLPIEIDEVIERKRMGDFEPYISLDDFYKNLSPIEIELWNLFNLYVGDRELNLKKLEGLINFPLLYMEYITNLGLDKNIFGEALFTRETPNPKLIHSNNRHHQKIINRIGKNFLIFCFLKLCVDDPLLINNQDESLDNHKRSMEADMQSFDDAVYANYSHYRRLIARIPTSLQPKNELEKTKPSRFKQQTLRKYDEANRTLKKILINNMRFW